MTLDQQQVADAGSAAEVDRRRQSRRTTDCAILVHLLYKQLLVEHEPLRPLYLEL